MDKMEMEEDGCLHLSGNNYECCKKFPDYSLEKPTIYTALHWKTERSTIYMKYDNVLITDESRHLNRSETVKSKRGSY